MHIHLPIDTYQLSFSLACTRNSHKLVRKRKQLQVGKSQKRKCKSLIIHMTYFRGKQTTMSLFTPKRPKLETQEISNIDKQQRNGYLMQCWWKRQSGCYSGEQFVTLTTTVKQMQPAAPRVHTSARRVTHTRPATKKYPADVQDSEEGLSLHHEQLFYDRCE